MAAKAQTKTATAQPTDQQGPQNAADTSKQQLAVRQQADIIRKELDLRTAMFVSLLPQHVKVEKFKTNLLTAINSDEKLLKCTKASLFRAAAEAAELGLIVNKQMGEGVIMPRWSGQRKRFEASFMPMFRGLMKLARQGGVPAIWSDIVYDKDQFHEIRGTEPKLIHEPANDPAGRGEKRFAYCCWRFSDGSTGFEVIDLQDIARSRRSAQTQAVWESDEDEMWRKTAVKRAAKYMPLEAEAFQKAVALDNAREGDEDVILRDGEVVIEPPEDITADAKDVTPKQKNSMDRFEEEQDGGGDPRDADEQDGEAGNGKPRGGEGTATTAANARPSPSPQTKPDPIQATNAAMNKPMPMPVPVTSAGQINWPAWYANATAAIKACTTAAQLQAWTMANQNNIGSYGFNFGQEGEDLNALIIERLEALRQG